LGADLDPALVESFTEQIKTRGFKVKDVLRRLAEFWLSCDESTQYALHRGDMHAGSLDARIRAIVTDVVHDAVAQRQSRAKKPAKSQ